MEDKEVIIRQLLTEKEKEYRERLASFSNEAIEKAIQKLRLSFEDVHKNPHQNLGLNLDDLDEETRKIFELMKQYQEETKSIFTKNEGSITHITTVSPENMRDGKIKPSHNRANNYETERGDWVFASSSPMDGKNPYIARQNGMILLDDKTYIYGGDVFDVQMDEQGNKLAVLRNPNYVYEINPESFTPVVTLKRDKNGEPFIEFSEEWVSENEMDLNNPEQVRGEPTVIREITDLLENYQILSDAKQYSKDERLIGIILRNCRSREEALEQLKGYIQNGDVRYINAEVGKNALMSKELVTKDDAHTMGIDKKVATSFAKEEAVTLEQTDASEFVERLNTIELENEEQQNSIE